MKTPPWDRWTVWERSAVHCIGITSRDSCRFTLTEAQFVPLAGPSEQARPEQAVPRMPADQFLLPENFSRLTYFQGERRSHSHSIVLGGLELMSYTTRFTPRTEFVIRVEIRCKMS